MPSGETAPGLVQKVSIWLLAGTFAFAAIDKLLHYDAFVAALRSYVILPKTFAPYLSLFVILVEFSIAIGLLSSGGRRCAALSATMLLVVFAAALGVNYYYSPSTPCGCWFTITLGESSPGHILLNLLLAFLAFTIAAEAPALRHART